MSNASGSGTSIVSSVSLEVAEKIRRKFIDLVHLKLWVCVESNDGENWNVIAMNVHGGSLPDDTVIDLMEIAETIVPVVSVNDESNKQKDIELTDELTHL